MKTKSILPKKNWFVFFLILSFSVWSQEEKPVAEFNKIIRAGGEIEKVVVKSDFSKIFVSISEGNQIKAKVKLYAYGKKAKEIGELFDFEISEKDNGIYLQTGFSDNSEKLKNKSDFVIRMVLEIPPDLELHIHSDFSEIHINELNNKLKIDADFSKLFLGYLNAKNNGISGDYLQSRIKFAHGLDIDSDFSQYRIDLSFHLNLTGNHTKLLFQRIKNLTAHGDFLKISGTRIYRMDFTGDYQTLNVKRVYSMDNSGDFSKIELPVLPKNFKVIEIEGSYGNIQIENPYKTPYVFMFKLKNVTWNVKGLEITKKEIKDGILHLKGYYGNSNAKSVLFINQKEGNIQIKNP